MLNGNKIVLLFGLPGAGKTTALQEILPLEETWKRLSGGSLISVDLPDVDRDKLRKLEKSQILLNQEKLVLGFKQELNKFSGKTIIFDGHCIVKDGVNVVEIPLSVIQRLYPDTIVFFDTSPEVIVERRSSDPNRPDREIESIEGLQKNRDWQIEICSMYAKELKIPMYIVSNSKELIVAIKT